VEAWPCPFKRPGQQERDQEAGPVSLQKPPRATRELRLCFVSVTRDLEDGEYSYGGRVKRRTRRSRRTAAWRSRWRGAVWLHRPPLGLVQAGLGFLNSPYVRARALAPSYPHSKAALPASRATYTAIQRYVNPPCAGTLTVGILVWTSHAQTRAAAVVVWGPVDPIPPIAAAEQSVEDQPSAREVILYASACLRQRVQEHAHVLHHIYAERNQRQVWHKLRL
jgi:hypothetical protein